MKKEVEYLDHENLVIMINQNRKRIIEGLTNKIVEPYMYLQNTYWDTNIELDEKYRKKFSAYYVMRYPNQDYKDVFFKIMEKAKIDTEPEFERIAKELFSVENKHQLSFITKFLNIRFEEYPIFDSFVSKVFNFKRDALRLEDKLLQDKEIINHMKEVYLFINKKKLIKQVIDDFDDKFPGNTLPFTKKVDFFVWRLGMIQEEDK